MLRHLLVLACSVVLIPAVGQYQFGFNAGPQYVRISTVLDADAGFAADLPKVDGFGYNAGVWYRSDVFHLVNFRAGLSWSYRTFDTPTASMAVEVNALGMPTMITAFEGTRYTRVSYLELPLQAQYYFWRGAYGRVGAHLARRVGGNTRTTGQFTISGPGLPTYRPDPTNEVSSDLAHLARIELASAVGVGYDFRGGICLGFSYLRGLTRMEEAKTLAASYTNQFRMELGYDILRPKGRRVYRRSRF